MIKALFFDSGDVLVTEGFHPGIIEYEKKYSLAEGSLYESAHDRAYWKDFTLGKISEEEYLKAVANDYQQSQVDTVALRQAIENNFVSNIELLDFLKSIKHKFILGVISNHPKEWFARCTQRFGWDNVFSIYAVSGNLEIRKPDKRIFEYAVNKAGVNPDECVYIDNRPDRVDGAVEIGIKVIIYTSNNDIKEKILTIND